MDLKKKMASSDSFEAAHFSQPFQQGMVFSRSRAQSSIPPKAHNPIQDMWYRELDVDASGIKGQIDADGQGRNARPCPSGSTKREMCWSMDYAQKFTTSLLHHVHMAFFLGKRKPIVHEFAVTSGIDRVAIHELRILSKNVLQQSRQITATKESTPRRCGVSHKNIACNKLEP